ncbi:early nodulin-like protein 1 [Pyrus ussuriensis x Pyrus communis]|uniref:Early nodulin-like protein 1 n=1 Tax=Pyrus ussuriensis x Pyrus communis TaxID=2448454 RepID=A0A5N5FH96_9ROSA|nr:early nodulin-like protein 1 [Pyrus ussuriensis x Pyrus communis]
METINAASDPGAELSCGGCTGAYGSQSDGHGETVSGGCNGDGEGEYPYGVGFCF